MGVRVPRTVSVLLLRNVVRGAEAMGLSREEFCRGIGIAPTILGDADATFPAETLMRAWSLAAERTGDPAFGLHVGEGTPVGTFEVLDYAVVSSENIGEGLRRACRYYRLVSDQVDISLEVHGPGTRLVHRVRERGAPGERHAWECYFATTVERFRLALGRSWRPDAVAFVHEAPGDAREHVRVFGVAPRFSQPVNEMVFPTSVLDTRVPIADVALGSLMVRYAEEQIARVPPDDHLLTPRARTAMIELLRGQEVTLDALARKLGSSGRTIQRRLQDEGVTFNELLDDVRKELAQRYLAQPGMALGEIGFLLGFAQPQAFHRAFKRWTGQSPALFRGRGTHVAGGSRRPQ